MKCPKCKNEMRFIEETHNNYATDRAIKGERTGDVYACDYCKKLYLDDFLSGELRNIACRKSTGIFRAMVKGGKN